MQVHSWRLNNFHTSPITANSINNLIIVAHTLLLGNKINNFKIARITHWVYLWTKKCKFYTKISKTTALLKGQFKVTVSSIRQIYADNKQILIIIIHQLRLFLLQSYMTKMPICKNIINYIATIASKRFFHDNPVPACRRQQEGQNLAVTMVLSWMNIFVSLVVWNNKTCAAAAHSQLFFVYSFHFACIFTDHLHTRFLSCIRNDYKYMVLES